MESQPLSTDGRDFGLGAGRFGIPSCRPGRTDRADRAGGADWPVTSRDRVTELAQAADVVQHRFHPDDANLSVPPNHPDDADDGHVFADGDSELAAADEFLHRDRQRARTVRSLRQHLHGRLEPDLAEHSEFRAERCGHHATRPGGCPPHANAEPDRSYAISDADYIRGH